MSPSKTLPESASLTVTVTTTESSTQSASASAKKLSIESSTKKIDILRFLKVSNNQGCFVNICEQPESSYKFSQIIELRKENLVKFCLTFAIDLLLFLSTLTQ